MNSGDGVSISGAGAKWWMRSPGRWYASAAAISLGLGIALVLALAWPIPSFLLWQGWMRTTPRADLWWAEEFKGGHYVWAHHALRDDLDFRRIIFVGAVQDQPFYGQNVPPRWAAVIHLDMREGFEQVVTTATGWPMRCFRGEDWITWRQPPAPQIRMREGRMVVDTPAPGSPERPNGLWIPSLGGTSLAAVPTEPIWLALAGNVAVFAIPIFTLMVVPAAVRRAIRGRKGRCTGCGYDLRALPAGAPCPECGRIEIVRA